MPVKRKVFDKHTGEILDMWEIDAREACANDTRYSLTKPPGFGAKPPAPLERKAGGKFGRFDHDKNGEPGGSLPKSRRGEPAPTPAHDEAVPTE